MRLEQFIPKNRYRQGGADVAPTIALNRDNCRVYFNIATVDILGLTAGDSLAYYRDADNAKNWYFTKVRKDHEGAEILRTTKKCRKALEISSGPLSKAIMDSAGAGKTCCLALRPLSVEGRGYWQILTDN